MIEALRDMPPDSPVLLDAREGQRDILPPLLKPVDLVSQSGEERGLAVLLTVTESPVNVV